ncbi:hypothetical protein MRB53_006173 [Persea americana]|uniref:Uncharacterized protein n=1 Tax=Persea americana TaxID=3435 RepID=A0ACC2MFF4_PERAE|nr:hypothetical protein MRB53_006173 [Persea americana]
MPLSYLLNDKFTHIQGPFFPLSCLPTPTKKNTLIPSKGFVLRTSSLPYLPSFSTISQGHLDAKIFKTKSLSFPNEMTTLFGGTQARGEDAWTPSSGSIPEDLSTQMAGDLLLDIGNTQNAVEQGTYEDVELQELLLIKEAIADALFQQYENENISLEASNDDDNGISDTDTTVDIAEQMEMSEVRDAIADALFQS